MFLCTARLLNQPWFKRVDLGRYLDIADIKGTYRDITTIPRIEIGGASNAPLKEGQNDHDVFVSLDSALEITVRSKKPRALALVKWLTRKGIENSERPHIFRSSKLTYLLDAS